MKKFSNIIPFLKQNKLLATLVAGNFIFLIVLFILLIQILSTSNAFKGTIFDAKANLTTTPIPTITNTPTPTFTPTTTPTLIPTIKPTSIQTTAKAEISRGNTSKKQIIFTFDAGSGNQSAQKVLDTADKYNLTLTFFLTGKWAEQNPSLTKSISNAGHEIFNHTYSHPRLPDISNEKIIDELNKTNSIIKNLTGKSTTPFFRLPYGYHGGTEDSKRVLGIAANLGYQSVLWSLDALDWWSTSTPYNGQTVNDDFVKNRIYSNQKNGAIILMHIGDDITGNILDEVFAKIIADGYDIVPLSKGL